METSRENRQDLKDFTKVHNDRPQSGPSNKQAGKG